MVKNLICKTVETTIESVSLFKCEVMWVNYECTALTNWATGPTQLTSFYFVFNFHSSNVSTLDAHNLRDAYQQN